MNIAIVGSGVVGQATGVGLASNGNRVIFHDVDSDKLLKLKKNGYNVTDHLEEAVSQSEIVFVCVPTPTVKNKIDLTYIQECTNSIGRCLQKNDAYTVIVFRSTIPPQTTRTKLISTLENSSNLRAGKDFGVCNNPEFLREKTPLKDFLNPSRIVIGQLDRKSGNTLQKIYLSFTCPLIRTDLDTAEMIKYASNMYLASKISFFNEIYLICQRLGLNSRVISKAVSLDPRIGKYGVTGGKPFGGMCLPKDLAAFLDFANSKSLNLPLLQAVAQVNQEINIHCSMSQELHVPREEYVDVSHN